MAEDDVRDEIAFIRRALEEGRGFFAARGPDLVVWGVAIALMYLGIYASIRGWWSVDPTVFWLLCTVPPWLYSLRWIVGGRRAGVSSMARAMCMLWLGCGMTLTTLAILLSYAGEMRGGFAAVTAGIMAIGFFASSFLCNLTWLRWVAAAWWLGEVATFALRHRPEVLLLAAVLMLLLLALPGIVLLRSRSTPATA
jgi:hypothetical protein